jgi:cytochrome c biogenesis protein CcmG, thiol:disulfide interchange protein DsbE
MRIPATRLGLLCILTLVPLWAGSAVAANQSGLPAIDFTLPTDTGSIRLADLRGKVVYVDFWASWCVPCRASFPWMNDMKAKYGDKGLVIVAINLDKERDLAKKFLAKLPAQFTIAYDPDWGVAGQYKVSGVPSSYLIDRSGKMRSTHLGFSEKDEPRQEDTIKKLLNEPR